MEMNQDESTRCIDGLAQTAPFRFVDRVLFLDETRVEAELHGRGLPDRFAEQDQADLYVILEFAAQSSGLVLRGRKNKGARGVIASFRGVENKATGPIRFPLRIESRLVDERWSMYEFDFRVHTDSELTVTGNIGIFIGR